MIDLQIDTSQVRELENSVKKSGRKLPQEIAIAINATARKAKVEMSREVRKELAVPAKSVKKTISTKSKATKSKLGSVVSLRQSNRIPLRDFKANQTRAGVSYKISKSGGRRTAVGAFQGPKPGVQLARWKGHVFARAGRSRLPIRKLYGVSPWGVFVKNKMEQPVGKATEKELAKQITRRIRFNVFKASKLT